MKKWGLILLALLALALALPAAAQDFAVGDLTTLAGYFAEDVTAFGALRTDEAYFTQLNAVLTGVGQAVRFPAPPVETLLSQQLATTLNIEDLDFATDIRPWLGATLAAGGGFGGVKIAVELSDPAAALDFFQNALTVNEVDFTVEEQDGYTLLTVETRRDTLYLAFYPDVLLASNSLDALDVPVATLADNAEFNDALARLPEPGYNALLFFRPADAARMAQQGDAADNLFGGDSTVVAGFTVLGDGSLTIDFVNVPQDPAPLVASGFNPASPAFDPAFASYVPSDAPLVIMDAGLNSDVANLQAMGQTADDAGMVDPDAADSLAQLQALQDATGINVQTDILDKLTGSYVVWARVVADDTFGALPDVAVVVQNTDSAAAAAILDVLEFGLTNSDDPIPFTRDGNTIVLTGALKDAAMGMMMQGMDDADATPDPAMFDSPALDLLVSYNDSVLVIGTRAAVEWALNPSGATLADDAAFQDSLNYALADAETFWYIGSDALAAQVMTAGAMMPDSQRGQVLLIGTALRAFGSATITARMDDDYTLIARAVLTLTVGQ